MVTVSTSRSWSASLAFAIALALFSVGCDSNSFDDPCGYTSPLYEFAYDSELATLAPGDSVLLMLGTVSHRFPSALDGDVYVNAQPSVDDSVRLDMHAFGWYGTQQTGGEQIGTIDHRWAGDTLQVWFGLGGIPPWTWGQPAEKCSPAPQQIDVSRVNLSLPEGVGLRVIHRPIR